MAHEKKVKDKRIELIGEKYLAVVDYYRDTPARDNDVAVKLMCEGLAEARKFLTKYPRDFWEEPGLSDRNYQELDERRRRGVKIHSSAIDSALQESKPTDSARRFVGRTFARLREGG